MEEGSEAPKTLQNSNLAIISLAFGISSWFLIPLIGGLVAVFLGHMAKQEIRASNGWVMGDGVATGGLILGYANIAVTVCAACALATWFLFATAMANTPGQTNLILKAFI